MEPRAFGAEQEQFGYFFNNREAYPRGQGSALLMAAEVASPGDWSRAFETPHLDKHAAPTVEGIDFPSLGVSQAWNNRATGVLDVTTYAAAPSRRGTATSWRVTNLPNTGDVEVRLNGQPFTRFEVAGPGTIRIDTTIDASRFEIVTGYRGSASGQAHAPAVEPGKGTSENASASVLAATAKRARSPEALAGGPGCPCCSSA